MFKWLAVILGLMQKKQHIVSYTACVARAPHYLWHSFSSAAAEKTRLQSVSRLPLPHCPLPAQLY